MSSPPLPVLTVRYPTGETEYRTSATPPNVGDRLSRNGDSWIVEEVTTSPSGGIVVRLGRGSTHLASEDEPA